MEVGAVGKLLGYFEFVLTEDRDAKVFAGAASSWDALTCIRFNIFLYNDIETKKKKNIKFIAHRIVKVLENPIGRNNQVNA